MWHVIAAFLGGMGLFFVGLRLTSEGVKKIAGRRFRDLFLHCTRSRVAAALLGVASGFVFQSTSGISLILASLIGAGVTTAAAALPVLIGANAGVSCLVLVAVIDINVLILLLLGLSGLVVAFDRPVRLIQVAAIAFGVGLLLFGLQTVRTGAAPLADTAWFRGVLGGAPLALPWYFLIGAAAGLVLQTSAGVTILAITMASSGLLTAESALAVILGSLMGTSALNGLYAARFTGARKRLVLGQALFNLVGLALFLPLFLLETQAGLPLLLAGAKHLLPRIDQQLTAIRLSFDTSTALLLLCVTPLYNRLLERLCPDADGGLDSLAYVKELTGVSPETAALLIDKEQVRIVRHLPEFTKRLRLVLESEKPSCPNVKPLADAIADLVKKLDDCLLDMVAKPLAEHTVAVLAALQDNQALLRAIGDALRQFVEELAAPCQSQAMRRLRFVFLEALEAILLQCGAVFTCAAAEEWDTLARLLSDKSPAMERLREHYLSETHDLPPADRWQVMRVTGLYERCLWLLAGLAAQQRRFLAETGGKAAVLTCAASSPAPLP